MWEEVERIAVNVYSGARPTHDSGLLKATVKQLSEGVARGYNRPLNDIAYNSPDFDMLYHLNQNVYHFSGAKNYQELKDITLALQDGDRILPESEFFQRVEAINAKYNRTWLGTERDTAIAGGQMAASWARFGEDSVLKYITVGDGQVRPGHRILDGIRKKKSNPFWKTYYPPNGYKCRCDVTESEGEETQDKDLRSAEVPPMFRTNLAEQGLIFPKNHPYYKGVPKAEIKKAISYLPPENTYLTTKADNGFININVLHGDNEVKQNLIIANDLLNAGYTDIKLLPIIHVKDAHLRKKFLPKNFNQLSEKKNPDAWIKDKKGVDMVCDFKYITGNGKHLSATLKDAAEQAEYAVIKLTDSNLNKYKIEKIILNSLNAHQSLKGVIVFDNTGKILNEVYYKK